MFLLTRIRIFQIQNIQVKTSKAAFGKSRSRRLKTELSLPLCESLALLTNTSRVVKWKKFYIKAYKISKEFRIEKDEFKKFLDKVKTK
jgi:hypothetical protein